MSSACFACWAAGHAGHAGMLCHGPLCAIRSWNGEQRLQGSELPCSQQQPVWAAFGLAAAIWHTSQPAAPGLPTLRPLAGRFVRRAGVAAPFSRARRLVAVLAVFFCSGVMHELLFWWVAALFVCTSFASHLPGVLCMPISPSAAAAAAIRMAAGDRPGLQAALTAALRATACMAC